MRKFKFNRIGSVLAEFDLYQKDLAEILGVTVDTVSRWRKNKSQPKPSQLLQIARLFRIDIRLLIEPTSWENEAGPSPLELFKAKKEEQRKSTKRHKKMPPQTIAQSNKPGLG